MDFDVIVIGGGSGGLPILRGASQLGLKVALIEKEKIGGDCLNYGCVPSKTLIKSAKVMHTTKNSKHYGVNANNVTLDFKQVMKRLRGIQKKIELHESVEYFEKLGIKQGVCKCCGGKMVIIEIIPNQFRKSQRAPPDDKVVNQVLNKFRIAS